MDYDCRNVWGSRSWENNVRDSASLRSCGESGQTVELIVSYRPAEKPMLRDAPAKAGAGHSLMDGLQRLGRPALPRCFPLLRRPSFSCVGGERNHFLMLTKLFSTAEPALGDQTCANTCSGCLMPGYRASLANHIVLFDQGFIQAVCSFVLLSRDSEGALIENALDLVPKSDLPIMLVATQDIIKARLVRRLRLQGRIEKLLECSIDENLRWIGIVDDLSKLLRRQGRYVPSIDSADQQAYALAIEQIRQVVTTLAGRLTMTEQAGPRWQHDV